MYVPAALQVIPDGFCDVDVDGVPLGNDQLHDVGELVELSVKLIVPPAQIFDVLAVNAATGRACIFTLST